MNKSCWLVLPVLLAAWSGSAAPAGGIDVRNLDELAEPKWWSPAESTVTAAEKFSGRPGIKWAVRIDHFGGEKKHPMGWPRAYYQRFKADHDWSAYDHLEFEVRGMLDDKSAKNMPLSFTIATTAARRNWRLPDLRDGKTRSMRIALAGIDGLEKIQRLGFVSSDSDFKHGAVFAVWAGNFRLTRSTQCRIGALQLTNPAVFQDQAQLRLDLTVEGAASHVARGVPFQISAGARIWRRETLPVRRGVNRLDVELSELRLPVGSYTLTLFPGAKELERRVNFKVVSSPFEVKK